MNPASNFKSRFRRVAPSVAALFAVNLLAAGAVMFPTLRSLPNSWDGQIFEPGGLYLLESLRIHQKSVVSGLSFSLLWAIIVQLPLLLVRARMTAVLVDASHGLTPRTSLFSKTPSYLLVSLLKLVGIIATLSVVALLVFSLPSFEGRLPPKTVALHALALTFGAALLGTVACWFDLYRLALFEVGNWKTRFRRTARAFFHDALLLLTRRAAWTVAALGAGALTFRLALRPGDHGSGWAIATFLLGQLLALFVLTIEVWWLDHAQKALIGADGKTPSSGAGVG